jgi:hypothetical protein
MRTHILDMHLYTIHMYVYVYVYTSIYEYKHKCMSIFKNPELISNTN